MTWTLHFGSILGSLVHLSFCYWLLPWILHFGSVLVWIVHPFLCFWLLPWTLHFRSVLVSIICPSSCLWFLPWSLHFGYVPVSIVHPSFHFWLLPCEMHQFFCFSLFSWILHSETIAAASAHHSFCNFVTSTLAAGCPLQSCTRNVRRKRDQVEHWVWKYHIQSFKSSKLKVQLCINKKW